MAGRRGPNGLRILFGLNKRRRCCGGVAQECTVISARPPLGASALWWLCKNCAVRPTGLL